MNSNKLSHLIKNCVKNVFNCNIDVAVTRPDEQFGDFATNVAMQLARELKRNPRDIADELLTALKQELGDSAESIQIAGAGFINIKLSNKIIAQMAHSATSDRPDLYKNKIVVAEYSDPNPFKVLHVGHVYTSVVGFAISNLIEAAGGEVHRVNFGGDVGLHVGKTMWAIIKDLGGELPEKLSELPKDTCMDWMANCYVEGNNAFDDNQQARAEIIELNKRVYLVQQDDDHDSPFAQIYWTCRQWSYEYFDKFYDYIGTPFEKYYPESTCSQIGIDTVKENLAKGVFEESDGAVVFKGEKYGLHTRVFINSHGVPTYEAKDIGLIMRKSEDYNFDRSVVITDNGQEQYMAVVLKAIEQFAPELANTTTHLTHGIVKLQGGVKMSSRKGNILRAFDALNIVAEASKAATGKTDQAAILGAIKYAFLKHRIGADIIYDPEESVSLEGNSGPYLQYAHARASSILVKAGGVSGEALLEGDLQSGERSLALKISEYPEVLQNAVAELMPHHICTYLYELSQSFNRFYEHNYVVGDERQNIRAALVKKYADILKEGLGLLGIEAPDRV
ncbi:MAG: arginine--tRNA ligase [Candidatus Woesebacteria bacterium]|jgi:arginyl-tRNA synthetase